LKPITPKDKFLEYFELIDIWRKIIMGMFGPKPPAPHTFEFASKYLHSGDNNSKYQLAYTNDLSVAKIKQASKKLECTLNNIILGVVPSTISEYM
jgi:hypothetical protein